jgi:excinuclease UvrABC nuclease subunit
MSSATNTVHQEREDGYYSSPPSESEIAKSKQEIAQPTPGIYFLFDGDEIVYIGKSINIESRVVNHRGQGEKEFDSYSFVEVHDELLRNHLEAYYIYTVSPKYNSVVPPNNRYFPLYQLKKRLKMDAEGVKRRIRERKVRPNTMGYYDLKELL